ncbi:Endochitinase 1 [Tulasnella sp. 419]|nr:Endochitinase 1 [Tulasnella sp. 419]
MSTYEPLPTEDTTAAETTYPPQHSPAKRTKSRLFRHSIIAAGILVIAFVLYKLEHPTTSQKADDTMSRSGKLNVAYFTNWGIYGRKYPPSLVPADDLTHVLYAFANLRAETGEVFLSDEWSDKDIHYPGDSWNDSGNNLYGNFKQFYLLKKKHRHLKLLLSIGGWTYSPQFHPIVVSKSRRAKFVQTSVQLLKDYGLDGLDIDYEYPSNNAQAQGYLDLLRELRSALDSYSREIGANYHFPLTIAAPCGPQNYEKLLAREMDQYLDFWNLMAYDYSGSWDQVANHQANVYGGEINTNRAVDWFSSQGIAKHKLIIGIPLYGRSFLATDGPGKSFSGVGPGSWEAGNYDYRALPLPGSKVFHDKSEIVSWSYDARKREFISFDDDQVAKWKAQWIVREGLGGAMYWELSGDKGNDRPDMEQGEGKTYVPGPSLVKVMKDIMGKLDDCRNWLEYPDSKFDNLKNGMPS